ncbi:hypothetical protein NE237_014250 [Protea cynaroides]|uniref:Uncharacterized protein n=1 Tax=Protea cynaroides TaxID=273540 RepID=A0A9Q0GKC3_9MAGN|nr:hypothetical protein NE237_014250 [Protea cynaroides]
MNFRVLEDDGMNSISMIDEPKLFFKFNVEEHRTFSLLPIPWLAAVEVWMTTEHYSKLIADRVCNESKDLSTTDPKTMNVTMNIKVDTVEVYEEDDDLFGESMEVAEQESEVGMIPTSRDAIEALEKVEVLERGDLLQSGKLPIVMGKLTLLLACKVECRDGPTSGMTALSLLKATLVEINKEIKVEI